MLLRMFMTTFPWIMVTGCILSATYSVSYKTNQGIRPRLTKAKWLTSVNPSWSKLTSVDPS